jgi:glutathione S-transferase
MATLLHYPLCPFSRSVRLALAECGIEAELAEERPWEWRAEFLALNPAGSLPVLISDNDGWLSAVSGGHRGPRRSA